MKLYENVIIGNFLYGLGARAALRAAGRPLPGAVNLLQQTPEDRALGDVLLSFPGVVRLIEFKRSENASGKEQARHRRLCRVLQRRCQHLTEVSRQVHWYVETAADSRSGVKTSFGPYIDELAIAASVRMRKAGGLADCINAIVSSMFTEADPAHDPASVSSYLQLVRWCQGTGACGAGALIVVVRADGLLHYAALKDMMELSMPLDRWQEYCMAPEPQPELHYEPKYTMDREYHR